jgi:dihydrofolate reductase
VPAGVFAATSIAGALECTGDAESVFVIGGAVVFREAFVHPQLRWVYLTKIDASFGCDVAIPNLDALGFARDAWDGARDLEDNGVRYSIARYAKSL